MAIASWEHDEWESWAIGLVRERYGHDQVVDVPDDAGGDHGLEAFTRGGIAFQCYSAENEPLPPTKRGALQKSKIGKDIKKFVDGGVPLTGILGSTVVHTWVLLTPYHQDASVIAFCNGKAQEVIDACLSYAADPFHVTVHHLETYRAEHEMQLRRRVLEMDLVRPPDPGLLGDVNYADTWSEQIGVMDGKLSKLPSLEDPAKRAQMRAALLQEQIQGGHLLDRWADRVPDVASHIQHVLETAKRQLVRSSISSSNPAELYQAVRGGLKEIISSDTGLSAINVEHIVDMALTDWLQQCDLDFVEARDV